MQDLRDASEQELKEFLQQHKQPAYRAAQIYDWVWKKNIPNIQSMSNIPLATRNILEQHYNLPKSTVDMVQKSADGTIKSRITLHDGFKIETVLIPTTTRLTACISSQVGCSLTCKFCATGTMERKRNLTAYEIFEQVQHVQDQCQQHYQRPLSNIVYMGMGEPLLNYSNVLRSVHYITSPDIMAMSPSRITISTAGIAKQIIELGNKQVKFNLALSLHAPTDEKRSKIMPINDSNSIKTLVEAMNYYYDKTKNPVTFEYILFKNVNDSLEDAEDLVKLCRKVPSKVNLIEYNAVDGKHFLKPDTQTVDAFMEHLTKNRVNVRLRRSRGKDIDAACGQLANK